MDKPATFNKLAEVTALADLLYELNERSDGILHAQVLDTVSYDTLVAHSLAELVPENHRDKFEDKYQRTVSKLTEMMETYIGDKWHDPVELAEWCGFQLGAALVHAELVRAWLPEHAEAMQQIITSLDSLLTHARTKIASLASASTEK